MSARRCGGAAGDRGVSSYAASRRQRRPRAAARRCRNGGNPPVGVQDNLCSFREYGGDHAADTALRAQRNASDTLGRTGAEPTTSNNAELKRWQPLREIALRAAARSCAWTLMKATSPRPSGAACREAGRARCDGALAGTIILSVIGGVGE